MGCRNILHSGQAFNQYVDFTGPSEANPIFRRAWQAPTIDGPCLHTGASSPDRVRAWPVRRIPVLEFDTLRLAWSRQKNPASANQQQGPFVPVPHCNWNARKKNPCTNLPTGNLDHAAIGHQRPGNSYPPGASSSSSGCRRRCSSVSNRLSMALAKVWRAASARRFGPTSGRALRRCPIVLRSQGSSSSMSMG